MGGWGAGLQDSHAHGYEDAEFLLLVDGKGPDYLPGHDGEDDVHGAGVGYAISQYCFAALACCRGSHTRGEDVIPDLVLLGPALARQAGVEYLLERHALAPREGDAEPQRDVDGDDDEPDELLGPAAGDAQHGDGERGLAPEGGEDGEGAGHVAVEEEGDQEVEVEVVEGPAEAEGHRVGDEAG